MILSHYTGLSNYIRNWIKGDYPIRILIGLIQNEGPREGLNFPCPSAPHGTHVFSLLLLSAWLSVTNLSEIQIKIFWFSFERVWICKCRLLNVGLFRPQYMNPVFGCLIHHYIYTHNQCDAWWRHQMETFSALPVLALCAGNSPMTGEFPAQRSVTRRCFL